MTLNCTRGRRKLVELIDTLNGATHFFPVNLPLFYYTTSPLSDCAIKSHKPNNCETIAWLLDVI